MRDFTQNWTMCAKIAIFTKKVEGFCENSVKSSTFLQFDLKFWRLFLHVLLLPILSTILTKTIHSVRLWPYSNHPLTLFFILLFTIFMWKFQSWRKKRSSSYRIFIRKLYFYFLYRVYDFLQKISTLLQFVIEISLKRPFSHKIILS